MPSLSAVHVKAVVHGPRLGRTGAATCRRRRRIVQGGLGGGEVPSPAVHRKGGFLGIRDRRRARSASRSSEASMVRCPGCPRPRRLRGDCAAAALPPCCHRGFICVASGADLPQDCNTREFHRRRKAGCLVSCAIPGCTLDIVGGVIGVSFLLSASQERALDG